MASFFSSKAGLSTQPLTSTPKSFKSSSGTLKRKRAGNDLGLPHTFDSTTKKSKRSRYNEVPNLSIQSPEVRVPDTLSESATTAVHDPGHERPALEDSGSSSALLSDREPKVYYKKPQLDLWNMWHEPSAHLPCDKDPKSATLKTTRKCRTESMTVVERKHFFIYTPTKGMKAAVKKYFSDIYKLLDMSGSNDDCRLHPTPPKFNGKPAGRISFGFNWKDKNGSHKLTVNWGILALVVRKRLTDAQMDGFVNKSWHLSHLCGNWTCCNWRHFTVESGPINSNRNGCFNRPTECKHSPPCMKEKKRQLLITNHIRNVISEAITSLDGILSDEALYALADYEIPLMERFWKNSRRGSCAFCGRSDDNAHLCSCLSSLEACKVMLRALIHISEPTLEVSEAIGYLVKIKKSLERASALKAKMLTGWFIRPGQDATPKDGRCAELRSKHLEKKEMKTAKKEIGRICHDQRSRNRAVRR